MKCLPCAKGELLFVETWILYSLGSYNESPPLLECQEPASSNLIYKPNTIKSKKPLKDKEH